MDILVVGAGVIGASIADALATRGAKVTVLDMRSPGRGASQASAGLLTPFIEGRSDSPLLGLLTRSLDSWDGFAARVRDRAGVDFIYERTGTLEAALNAEEAARLNDMRVWLGGLNVDSQWMDSAEVRRFEPALSPVALGGLLIPSQGFVAVSALVKALVQAARFSGAVFEQPVEAVRIEQKGDHVHVRADDRVFTADAVVVAAGTWSGRVRIIGAPAMPVKPMRGQLLQLQWRDSPLPLRPVWGARSYTVPWAPETLLVGATLEDAGFDERTTVTGVQDLLAGVSEMLPGAVAASLAEVRVGLRPSTADGLPIIGPLAHAPRVCVATGHYRNGVLLAPLTADIVANYLLDAAEDPAFGLTSPNRFKDIQ